MPKTPEKHHYTFADYDYDLIKITWKYKSQNNLHIVAPYRGGLPLGVALSNRLDAPLSILDYQRYDGETEEVSFMKNAGIEVTHKIILVDDLVDEGITIDKCYEFLSKEYPHNDIEVLTIFGRPGYRKKYNYMREHPKKWIHFDPWE